MKAYTREQMINKYSNLPKSEKITVLWNALDLMQAYNGRNKLDCVFMAMDYEPDGENWVNTISNI